MIRGTAAPIPDPIAAGSHAAADFLREWRTNSGLYVDIPPSTRLEMFAQKAQPNEVVSGIVDITQTAGAQRVLW